MCLPIQYALTYPERIGSDRVQTDLAKLGQLTFEEPDHERFPALDLARKAGEVGGTLPAVLNAANEMAVNAFISGRLRFPEISQTVARVMGSHAVVAKPTLQQILEADAWARQEASVK
jgi:1-deoxy-D-xylulose-5-phosphate reductoisomerase